MSSSEEIPKSQESETLEQPKPPKDPVQDQEINQEQPKSPKGPFQDQENHEEEEEEGECGFCLFMKAGGCKDTFVEWENCVMEGEKNNEDIVRKCFEVTAALKVCMQAHPDHYGILLDAQEAAENEALEELEKEKERDMEYTAARESRSAKK